MIPSSELGSCRGLCQAAADALRLSPGDECDGVSPCREAARHFILEHFPVQALREPAEEAVGQGARMPPAKMRGVYKLLIKMSKSIPLTEPLVQAL